jgi:oxygen-independent coproporphyrinogen-3 oxidase
MSPRAAYVHVPFCRHRCGYCNFTVVAGRDDLIESYLLALERELSSLREPQPVETLFLGGGTPTHLRPEELRRLLQIVGRWFPLESRHQPAQPEGWTPTCEFSVEANPADLDAARSEVLAEFGVNRISLGAQSFDARKLELLERDHRAAEIERSAALARERFGSMSLDLIFACPGETLDDWSHDLNAALELRPDHISTYGLTFERGTTFWGRRAKGKLLEADEELQREMYSLAIDRLAAAGFEHYEVSNFARPGHRCRHNEVYWAAEEYYAAGPGAARYVRGRRETNHRSTTTYIARVLAGRSPVAEAEELPPEDRAREALVLGLRRIRGVDRREFAERFGCEVGALVGPPLSQLIDLGFLSEEGDTLRLTRQGLFVSDSIWPMILRR